MMSRKMINVWDAEHNELSETISFKVTCDQEVIDLIKAITYRDNLTIDEAAFELGSLLERAIHLNLPRSHRFWNRDTNG
tara:strand:- start:194 stop:430 length:237 start_codon:yes stop_codon:yes gene_type:complete